MNSDTKVEVWSDTDMDTKVRRARDVRCPNCARGYDDMTWFDNGHVAMLICYCGETFKEVLPQASGQS